VRARYGGIAAAADASCCPPAASSCYVVLENRIKLFVALPIEKLDRLAIQRSVDEIGGRGVVATIATPRLEL
jgi:hypothetical protein